MAFIRKILSWFKRGDPPIRDEVALSTQSLRGVKVEIRVINVDGKSKKHVIITRAIFTTSKFEIHGTFDYSNELQTSAVKLETER